MCVDFLGDWKVTEEDIIAYKVVRLPDRGSVYEPPCRVPQDGNTATGRMKYYPKGSTRRCSKHGIYCYRTREDANKFALSVYCRIVLEVMIPANSRVRRGANVFGKTINASQVVVMT